MSTRSLLALCSASIFAISCYAEPFADQTVQGTDLRELASQPAEGVFDAAAEQYGVPADLLAALAWHSSSFAPGDHDHDEHAPAFGWMGLRPDQVDAAALLTGLDPEAIQNSREANIFAGAAVLADLQAVSGAWASPSDADERWWNSIVAWNDFDQEWMNHEFAMDLFRTLQRGLHVPTVSGDVVEIAAREIPGLADVRFVEAPRSESGLFHGGGTTDYPGAARFIPAHSSNQSSRSGGASAIRRVVIHTVEGSYNGAIGWFQNPSSNVSAHYVVRKSDGEITQQVRDAKKGWHVCGSNNDTIGIEHEGAASNAATWTPQILDASARLTAWLVTQYGIPIDRTHIVGHGEIQGAGCSYRYDPGPHFPWTQYMTMVQNFADGGTSGAAPPDDGVPDAPTLPDGPAPASITFQTPTQDATVGNPVIMRVANTGIDHLEIWAGPYLLAQHLTANPVNYGYRFNYIGRRTLTTRGYSNAGALLATDSVSITIRNVPTNLSPGATKVSGPTYRMSTSGPTNGVAYVKYWVDGWPLKDDSTNSRRAPGPSYGLTYTFNFTAPGRLLQARAYASDGTLLAEGFSYIDVDGSTGEGGLIEVDGYEVTGQVIRLTSQATPGVATVEYVWNSILLTDMATGSTAGVPDEFEIFYDFPVAGAQSVVAMAYNAAGQLIDQTTMTVVVPSNALEVTWTRSAWHQYKFEATAPAGSYKVVIEIDEWALPDQNTGDQYTLGPDFVLDYRFNYGGTRQLHAVAYDPVGNIVDEFDTTIEVY
jgi:hypothetical protein